MGGNALKKHEVSRMNRKEFVQVCSDVMRKLRQVYGIKKEDIRILPFYKNKESFGDIDILIASEVIVDKKDFNNKLLNEVGSKEIAPTANFNIHSFEFGRNNKSYQVDLMFHPRKEMDAAEIFYGYNDLSVLINQFAMPTKDLNLAFSKKGLVKNIYADEKKNKKIGEIIVETDLYKVMDYLGLDVKKHKEEINNKEDLFNFVIDSHNFDFNSMMAKLESPNNDMKTRLKRPNFIEFISYAENNANNVKFNRYKNSMEYFDSFFPGVLKEEQSIITQYNIDQDFKKKLDGNFISNVSGLELKDKRLGMLCKKVRECFDNDDQKMINWIKKSSEKDRKDLVLQQRDVVVGDNPHFISIKKNKP